MLDFRKQSTCFFILCISFLIKGLNLSSHHEAEMRKYIKEKGGFHTSQPRKKADGRTQKGHVGPSDCASHVLSENRTKAVGCHLGGEVTEDCDLHLPVDSLPFLASMPPQGRLPHCRGLSGKEPNPSEEPMSSIYRATGN